MDPVTKAKYQLIWWDVFKFLAPTFRNLRNLKIKEQWFDKGKFPIGCKNDLGKERNSCIYHDSENVVAKDEERRTIRNVSGTQQKRSVLLSADCIPDEMGMNVLVRSSTFIWNVHVSTRLLACNMLCSRYGTWMLVIKTFHEWNKCLLFGLKLSYLVKVPPNQDGSADYSPPASPGSFAAAVEQ